MKKLFKILLILLPVAVLLFVLTFIYMVIEDKPLVVRMQTVDVASAKYAKETIKWSLKTIMKATDSATITLSEKEINILLAFASRGVKQFAGDAAIGSWGLSAAATLNLPDNPLGQYVNFEFGVEPSESG